MREHHESQTKSTVSHPAHQLKWKKIKHPFTTILGKSNVELEVLDHEGPVVFRPGEEQRLEKIQAERFLKRLLADEFLLGAIELKFLLKIFQISQANLAKALSMTPAAVSNMILEKNAITQQSSKQLAVYFTMEINNPGFLKNLADGAGTLNIQDAFDVVSAPEMPSNIETRKDFKCGRTSRIKAPVAKRLKKPESFKSHYMSGDYQEQMRA